MKLRIFILLFAIIPLTMTAQDNSLGYRIEGKEVIFTFDVRDYEKVTKDDTDDKLDFGDLEIYDVAVSGEFNDWSKKGWRMKKTGAYTYELRKNIESFNDAFSWEFKFIINNKYWAEPDENAPNRVDAKKNGFWLHVYNLKMYKAAIDEDGNAKFHLPGYLDAQEVILAGSFNKWDEYAFKMNKNADGWTLTLQLLPDSYQYKFIVDGEWMEDPHNPEKVPNEYGGYNSVMNITKEVIFTLEDYRNAKKVILSGTFNNWDEHAIDMRKSNEKWRCTLDLAGGKHHYKFIVDGKWIIDPKNPIREYDKYGNINSVKMVE
ncbi:hypothetical protein ACFQ1M_16095 [Sungkyunkwania multivorans]|uniref:AMP-activated protein kinase glycogen-binding domain-containing protein n=1 Tax=Sungkyunkwania multivorans TaxID=1173618 RepID=A0ABW3D355_9FLAO